jgi:hypothetical protein
LGVTIATSWPKRVREATVWVSVVTTPLVCGDHASLTIMIFIQRLQPSA